MVEGARLESGYMGNCVVGSNPTLSAKKQATTIINFPQKMKNDCFPKIIRPMLFLSTNLSFLTLKAHVLVHEIIHDNTHHNIVFDDHRHLQFLLC